MYFEIDTYDCRICLGEDDDGYSTFEEAVEEAKQQFRERMESAENQKCWLEDEVEGLDEEIEGLQTQLDLLDRVGTWEEYLDARK